MTEQGRPTGIQYEDAADAAMHGGSVDFEGRKVRVLSLNSKTGTDEAPSAQLDLDLGEEYLVLMATSGTASLWKRGASVHSKIQHSPAPIGPGPPAKDAHIVGY
jgi:hypothetical protein